MAIFEAAAHVWEEVFFDRITVLIEADLRSLDPLILGATSSVTVANGYGTVSGAMIYPILLAVVGIAVVVLMLGFVLPRFTGLFETLDAPLPPTTQVLMALSGSLRSFWWATTGRCSCSSREAGES